MEYKKIMKTKELPLVFQLAQIQKKKTIEESRPYKLIEVTKYQTKMHTIVPIMKPISKTIDFSEF